MPTKRSGRPKDAPSTPVPTSHALPAYARIVDPTTGQEIQVSRTTEARSLARSFTPEMIYALVQIALDTSKQPSARVSAATAVLDRGWGKPTQPISAGLSEVSDAELATLVQLIAVQRLDVITPTPSLPAPALLPAARPDPSPTYSPTQSEFGSHSGPVSGGPTVLESENEIDILNVTEEGEEEE